MRNIFFFFLFIFISSQALAEQKIFISISRPQDAPYFVGIPEANIYSDDFNTIILRVKSGRSGTARLFWASSYDPQFNQPKSIWFYYGRSDYPKEYVFNVHSQNPNWIGFIKQILIYPDNELEGFKIDSAMAIPGGLITNIRSGWREFWGPDSREILGSTVNNMRATRLRGRTINLYIYAILILLAISSFSYSFAKTKDLHFSWRNCGRTVILAGIAFYILLALSNMASQYHQLKADIDKYDFKSLEEKQAISVGRDFYSFLTFCRQQLPERANVLTISTGPNRDFFIGKATYYLYPLNFFSKEPDYIIAYDYEKDVNGALGEYPKYRLLKKYHEGAFVLCKKRT